MHRGGQEEFHDVRAFEDRPPACNLVSATPSGTVMVRPDTGASAQAAARRHGLLTTVAGLAIEAVVLGIVAISAAVGASNTMVAGTALLVGWIVTGFGMGESLFGNRLRLVTMLLALLVGIAGLVFSFWAIHQLGYDLRSR